MFKKFGLTAATLATVAAAMVPAAADAQRHGRYDGQPYARGYYQDGRVYRSNDNYYRHRAPHRCSDGTAGAIVGAIAGGLLGRVIDRGGDRSVGTILGAGGGALAGRAIERDGSRQAANDGRCYR